MNEHYPANPSAPADAETDVMSLLKKLQQQMVFLEKKLDLIISRQEAGSGSNEPGNDASSEHSSFKDRHFSKPPFRPYGSHPRRSGGHPGERPSGMNRGHYGSDRSYGRPRREHPGSSNGRSHGSGFAGSKKPFYRGPKSRG